MTSKPVKVAALAAAVIVVMVVVYGSSTTRTSAAVQHDPGAPGPDEAALRVVVAHDLPVRITLTEPGGDARTVWPVGPGSDRLVVDGSDAAFTVRVESFSFDAPGAERGTLEFRARGDVAETLAIAADGATETTLGESGRPDHHTLAVRGPSERTTRAWTWTPTDRESRTVFTSTAGTARAVETAFLPGVDVTVQWELAGPLHDRSAELVFEPGTAHELIVDRDGRWTHRRPGMLRAWWMRR